MNGNHELKKNINKYRATETRYHLTTSMLIAAVEQNKPKSVLKSIIKKRLEYMSILIELAHSFVENGVTPEQRYLQLCKDCKEQYQRVQAHMENY